MSSPRLNPSARSTARPGQNLDPNIPSPNMANQPTDPNYQGYNYGYDKNTQYQNPDQYQPGFQPIPANSSQANFGSNQSAINQGTGQGNNISSQGYGQNSDYYDNYGYGYNQNSYTVGVYGQAQAAQPEKPKEDKVGKFFDAIVKNWIKILIIVILVLIIFVGGFLFWNTNHNKPVQVTEYKNVLTTLEAPPSLPKGTPSGGEGWKITVKNNESTPLLNLQINLSFDNNFEFISASRAASDNMGKTYFIPKLDAAGTGTDRAILTIQGRSKGSIDEEILMSGEISYTPQILQTLQTGGKISPGSDIQMRVPINSVRTKTTAPQLNLSVKNLVGGETEDNVIVASNSEIEMVLNIKNQADRDLQDIRIVGSYPTENFIYGSSSVNNKTDQVIKDSPDSGNNVWQVSSISAFNEINLKIKGKLQGADGSRPQFKFRVLTKIKDDYSEIAVTSKDLVISSKPLSLNTRIEGKGEGQTFRAGETLTFLIDYENKGTVALREVEIFGFIEDPAEVLDWNTVSFSGGIRATTSNKVVQWRGANTSQLITLTPGQKGSLRYTIKVKDKPSFYTSYRKQSDYILIPKVQYRAQNLAQDEDSGLSYKAKGELEFEQKIVDLGVLNTQSNKRKWSVVWTLKSDQTQINQVSVRTFSKLENPWKQSSVTPAQRGTEISYDPRTGEIIWKPNTITAYSGKNAPQVNISFEIEADNNERELFDSVEAVGVDDFTQEKYQIIENGSTR